MKNCLFLQGNISNVSFDIFWLVTTSTVLSITVTRYVEYVQNLACKTLLSPSPHTLEKLILRFGLNKQQEVGSSVWGWVHLHFAWWKVSAHTKIEKSRKTWSCWAKCTCDTNIACMAFEQWKKKLHVNVRIIWIIIAIIIVGSFHVYSFHVPIINATIHIHSRKDRIHIRDCYYIRKLI